MPASHDPAALTVHLPAIPSRGGQIAVRADREALDFGETDFALAGPLSLDGRIERLESEGFRLRARLGGTVTIECVRCLAPVAFPLGEDLDLVWLPPEAFGAAPAGGGPADPGERFLEAAEMNVSVYQEDRLRLSETLWEQVHLALPTKPLCADDCLGLCPSCGTDRNRLSGDCGCGDEAPAGEGVGLGALRELFAARQPPG